MVLLICGSCLIIVMRGSDVYHPVSAFKNISKKLQNQPLDCQLVSCSSMQWFYEFKFGHLFLRILSRCKFLDHSLIVVSRNTIQYHCRKETFSQFIPTNLPLVAKAHWKNGVHWKVCQHLPSSEKLPTQTPKYSCRTSSFLFPSKLLFHERSKSALELLK